MPTRSLEHSRNVERPLIEKHMWVLNRTKEPTNKEIFKSYNGSIICKKDEGDIL